MTTCKSVSIEMHRNQASHMYSYVAYNRVSK